MHENYGGILQAYATVSYLENQNIEYELVRYTRKKTVTEALCHVFLMQFGLIAGMREFRENLV